MSANRPNPFRLRRVERMTEQEILRTFCPPHLQSGLFDRENVIFQGPRGSGKSTILRRLCAGPTPQLVDRTQDGALVCGTYLTLGQPWVSSFGSPSLVDPEVKQSLFVQALNVSALAAFAKALRKLSATTGDDFKEKETRWASWLAKSIKRDARPVVSSDELQTICQSVLRDLRDAYLRKSIGEPASLPASLVVTTPFQSLVEFVDMVGDQLREPVCWMIAIDELDNLSFEQQRIFNTIVRNTQNAFTVKAACLPSGHKTHETVVGGNPLRVGDDFEYVALWASPKSQQCTDFCEKIFQSRAKLLPRSIVPAELIDWVGASTMTERAKKLKNFSSERDWDEFAKESELQAQLWKDEPRKYHPALALRVLRDAERGNAHVALYAGAKDVIAASDGNPRRLLRLFDRLFEASSSTVVPEEVQSAVIRTAADGAFDRLAALPTHGLILSEMVDEIGNHLSQRLSSKKAVVADSCSFEVDPTLMTETTRAAFETGVDYGCFFPKEFDQRNGYPRNRHVYWLSFGLAPRYRLLLRSGEAVSHWSTGGFRAERIQGLLQFGGET
jgi:hypothetical protein